jgi:lauroyl/myristoyl acyltransferase
VTRGARPLASARCWLRGIWGTRPSLYSRPLWALIIALDYLPWPVGEDALAALFGLVALARPSRRRLAFAWARRQTCPSAWKLALAVSAFRGRWVARSSLIGLRAPEDLRRRVVVRGEEHLAAAAGGTILLGFHLGPPNVDVALRTLGHRLAWLGVNRSARAWSRPGWRPLNEPGHNLAPPSATAFWPGYVYRARRLLLEGGTLVVMADSGVGRELFQVPLPGGPAVVRSSWFLLWRETGARVLPVMTHLEGHTQVVTIHPALPPPAAGGAEGLDPWRTIVSEIMAEYVRRFPEQCPALVFPPLFPRRSGRVRVRRSRQET